jgi:hypothetical protein
MLTGEVISSIEVSTLQARRNTFRSLKALCVSLNEEQAAINKAIEELISRPPDGFVNESMLEKRKGLISDLMNQNDSIRILSSKINECIRYLDDVMGGAPASGSGALRVVKGGLSRG